MKKAFRLVSRPPNAEHGHSLVVYNCTGQLHYELTRFTKVQLDCQTIRVYLYALLPYFTWLDTDKQQLKSRRHWQEAPEQIQQAVEDYLVQQMSCFLQQHINGCQLVRLTDKTPSKIRTFLAALKCFYKHMKQLGYYPYANPLVDSSAEILVTVNECLEEVVQPPRMPSISGVQEPHPRKRLTDNYYKLIGDEWIPQIINNPNLPRQILEGGRQLSGWGWREEVVTRLLFETGARVSEIVGLTLCDWVERGMQQEASAFSKGSKGRRIKFIRFSNDTAKLLQRYFNEERIKYDSNGYTLHDYLQVEKLAQADLRGVPIFITTQKTALTAKNYRDNYWKPACEATGVKANLHQARHWYVTMAIRQIYEISTTNEQIERRLEDLKEYMKWKSQETMNAYNHCLGTVRHAEIQDRVLSRMDKAIGLAVRQVKDHQRYTLLAQRLTSSD